MFAIACNMRRTPFLGVEPRKDEASAFDVDSACRPSTDVSGGGLVIGGQRSLTSHRADERLIG